MDCPLENVQNDNDDDDADDVDDNQIDAHVNDANQTIC